VAGREDGRVLTMKLVAGLRVPCYRPVTAADRRHFLLDAGNSIDSTRSSLDPLYQRRPTSLDDHDDDGTLVILVIGQLSLASLRGRLIEYQLRLG